MQRFLLALVALARLSAQVPDAVFSAEQRAWVASKLYASIRMFYAHREGAPGFDLDRDYKAYLRAAMAAENRRGFDLATMAFMGKLRNGHSGFYDKWLLEQFGQPLGFSLQSMREGWVVITSQVAELDPGDVAVSVNGTPMEQFYAEHDGMLEGSSEASRRQRFPWLAYLWPERFDLGLASGKHVTIDRRNQKLVTRKEFPFPQGPVTTPKGVGYIRIRSFEDPENETFAVKRVKELMAAEAIIFDVRGNGGGATPMKLISALLDRPWRDFRYTTPVHIAHAGAQNQVRKAFPGADSDPYLRGYLDAYDEFKDVELLTPGPSHAAAADAYKGKVYLLVDAGCTSACEDFIQPFKSSGRGVQIGEASNGSSGQPYYYDFGNGMSFRISSKRYYLPDGSPFEGVGIKPDVEVRPSLADWKAGSDPVLAKALQLASAK